MLVTVLSADFFSSEGIKTCLRDGRVEQVNVVSGSALPEPGGSPDVVVIDAGFNSHAVVNRALEWAHGRQVPSVIIFSQLRKPWIDAAIAKGASAVLSRAEASACLPEVVHAVADGRKWLPELPSHAGGIAHLSTRELETLRLYCDGTKIDDIARQLHVSASTVNTYLTRIRAKYNATGRPVRTRLELRREASEDGWVRAT